MEAELCSRIGNSGPSDTGLREHSDVGAVKSLSSVEGKGSSFRLLGIFKCGGAHFQRDCNARKSTGKQSSRQAKAIKASHGPRARSQSQAKERVKRTLENPIQVSKGSGYLKS